MRTANSVMREIWINISKASDNNLEIDKGFLYSLLKELEKEQYEQGYSDGYEHSNKAHASELPINDSFKGYEKEW